MIEACLTERPIEKAKDTTRKLCFDARSILGSRSRLSIDLGQIGLRLYLKLRYFEFPGTFETFDLKEGVLLTHELTFWELSKPLS